MERNDNLQNRSVVASIYKKYYSDLKQYLVSYTHDVMAAEDMLQDLFIKVMSLDVISEDTAKNLLLVMAKRMIIDDARHKASPASLARMVRTWLSFFSTKDMKSYLRKII